MLVDERMSQSNYGPAPSCRQNELDGEAEYGYDYGNDERDQQAHNISTTRKTRDFYEDEYVACWLKNCDI